MQQNSNKDETWGKLLDDHNVLKPQCNESRLKVALSDKMLRGDTPNRAPSIGMLSLYVDIQALL